VATILKFYLCRIAQGRQVPRPPTLKQTPQKNWNLVLSLFPVVLSLVDGVG
jgi:hypothetical protein